MGSGGIWGALSGNSGNSQPSRGVWDTLAGHNQQSSGQYGHPFSDPYSQPSYPYQQPPPPPLMYGQQPSMYGQNQYMSQSMGAYRGY